MRTYRLFSQSMVLFLQPKLLWTKETGNSKCFGFVEMEDETEGFNAINALNETEFQGRKIVVKKARPREEGGDDRGQKIPKRKKI